MDQQVMRQRQAARTETTPPGKRMAGPDHARLTQLALVLNAGAVTQRAPNRTGLPDGLKAGVEALSGISMDHVRIHYDSGKPAQLNANAYAQGSDIHLAPGQQRHLPHEAWHVVQQAQGRVKPTMQMKSGALVNDDAALEYEADVMGASAAGMWPVSQAHPIDGPDPAAPGLAPAGAERQSAVRQRSVVVQRDVRQREDSGRWYTHLDIGPDGNLSFARKEDALTHESGLQPDITLEMLDHAVEPVDARGIVNIESDGFTGRHNERFPHAESPCMTFFNNAITAEGGFIFQSNYRQATPKTKFYASQVAEKQWELAQAQFDGHPPAEITKIKRQNVENPKTKEIMKKAEDDGVTGDALMNLFLNTTPNGKSTKHILDAMGYRATSITLTPLEEGERLGVQAENRDIHLDVQRKVQQLGALDPPVISASSV